MTFKPKSVTSCSGRLVLSVVYPGVLQGCRVGAATSEHGHVQQPWAESLSESQAVPSGLGAALGRGAAAPVALPGRCRGTALVLMKETSSTEVQ